MSNEKIEKFAIDFVFSFEMFDKVIFGVRTKKQFAELIENINKIKKISKKKIDQILKINKENFYFSSSKNKYNS